MKINNCKVPEQRQLIRKPCVIQHNQHIRTAAFIHLLNFLPQLGFKIYFSDVDIHPVGIFRSQQINLQLLRTTGNELLKTIQEKG